MSLLTNLDTTTLIARAKLPDDTTVLEFNQLTAAIRSVAIAAIHATERRNDAAAPTDFDYGSATQMSEPTVSRVQYGSDFVFVLSIAMSTSGVLLALTKSVKNLVEAATTVRQGRLFDAQAAEASANARKTSLEISEREESARAEARRRQRAFVSIPVQDVHDTIERALYQEGVPDVSASSFVYPIQRAGRIIARNDVDLAVEGDD